MSEGFPGAYNHRLNPTEAPPRMSESGLIRIEAHKERLYREIEVVHLPAVPREGESLTLEDDHYVVKGVFWQANSNVAPGWPDNCYYTIRLLVVKKVFDL